MGWRHALTMSMKCSMLLLQMSEKAHRHHHLLPTALRTSRAVYLIAAVRVLRMAAQTPTWTATLCAYPTQPRRLHLTYLDILIKVRYCKINQHNILRCALILFPAYHSKNHQEAFLFKKKIISEQNLTNENTVAAVGNWYCTSFMILCYI